jgi:hypothetical protein
MKRVILTSLFVAIAFASVPSANGWMLRPSDDNGVCAAYPCDEQQPVPILERSEVPFPEPVVEVEEELPAKHPIEQLPDFCVSVYPWLCEIN